MANVTNTTAAVFIPEVWKEAILDYAERRFQLRNQVTNVSDLAGGGDTIHVPRVSEETAAAKSADTAVTYSAQTDGETQISIDQHAYEAKRIEDITRVQSSYDLFSLYTRSMGYGLAKKVENYLAVNVIQAATANDVSLATDNTPTSAELRSGIQKLMDIGVDYTDGDTFLYASPAAYMNLLNLGEFSDFQQRGPEASGVGPNISGQLGIIYGMPVFSSVDWDDDGGTGDETMSIFTRESVLLAMQMEPRVQSEYDIDYLSTSVVADVLFGASLSQPAADAAGQVVNFNNPS
ncbi:MAG: hypothetical protein CMJ25_17885 [Phycisphaerae bacterium]|nr:hypothetical protein [Phycisphaerae bacterium]|tara:strand:- start:2244 stop:3119 length:876 start_codon:yes stop_codon:yes gene_type:complete